MLIFYFDKFLLNNAYSIFSCVLTEKFLEPYLRSIIKLSKITEVIIHFFLCITHSLSHCANIEINSAPRYSSLTFCCWTHSL